MSNSETLRANMNASMERRPAIANGANAPASSNRQFEGRRTLGNGCRIKTDRIRSDPGQPRKTFGTEADGRLADNMRVRGQLVPILVRWDAEANVYVVIDGDRRFRAATQAGLPEMTCVVENESDPDAILEMQLIANALREDVSPVEQARAWQRLMESQGLTQRQLADKLGYTHGTITKKVALLDLPEAIQADVDSGRIKAETGYFIAQVADPAEQEAMAEQAKAGNLKRDEARDRASQSRSAASKMTGQGDASKAKAKARPKVITSRTFKGEGGLRITVERARGLDLAALLAAMEHAVETIRGELAQAG